MEGTLKLIKLSDKEKNIKAAHDLSKIEKILFLVILCVNEYFFKNIQNE